MIRFRHGGTEFRVQALISTTSTLRLVTPTSSVPYFHHTLNPLTSMAVPFLQARLQKLPFVTLRPGVGLGIIVQDLKWNPVQVSMLATCLSDGSMMVLEVTDSVTVQAQLPATEGITCGECDIMCHHFKDYMLKLFTFSCDYHLYSFAHYFCHLLSSYSMLESQRKASGSRKNECNSQSVHSSKSDPTTPA